MTQGSASAFSCLEAGELYLEGDNLSIRKSSTCLRVLLRKTRAFFGFSPSRPPTFPSTAWGSRPKTLRSFARSNFSVQKYFVARQSLAYRLFVCSQCSHFCRFAAKTTKIRVYSVRFWASKVFSLPPRSIFSLQKFFHCLPEAISGFKRTFTHCLACFWRSKVLLLLRSAYFGLQKNFCCLVAARCAAYRLFVCSQCSHFCRFAAKTTKIRAFYGKEHKNSRLFCACRSAMRCLPSFCLLAPLAFLPLCGKKHKNSCLFYAFLPFKSGFNSIQTKIIIQ